MLTILCTLQFYLMTGVNLQGICFAYWDIMHILAHRPLDQMRQATVILFTQLQSNTMPTLLIHTGSCMNLLLCSFGYLSI